MGDGREAGVFLGHTEGLTYVDSKGDGRYVLSNGKDQTAKLWDLRKMMSKEKADKIDPNHYTTRFEYRSNAYDPADFRPHPHDCSLVTFRGHKVLKTLIRCHFSPPGSTDSRYVYSGSYDGSVYIWNLDATLAGKVNVLKATKNSRPRDPELQAETYDYWGRNGGNWMTCVRDASWHPTAPMIAGMFLPPSLSLSLSLFLLSLSLPSLSLSSFSLSLSSFSLSLSSFPTFYRDRILTGNSNELEWMGYEPRHVYGA
jgi:WD repeat-containing protein 23